MSAEKERERQSWKIPRDTPFSHHRSNCTSVIKNAIKMLAGNASFVSFLIAGCPRRIRTTSNGEAKVQRDEVNPFFFLPLKSSRTPKGIASGFSFAVPKCHVWIFRSLLGDVWNFSNKNRSFSKLSLDNFWSLHNVRGFYFSKMFAGCVASREFGLLEDGDGGEVGREEPFL